MDSITLFTTLGVGVMPTGYTARIKDGMEFKEYALEYARAFGACLSLQESLK